MTQQALKLTSAARQHVTPVYLEKLVDLMKTATAVAGVLQVSPSCISTALRQRAVYAPIETAARWHYEQATSTKDEDVIVVAQVPNGKLAGTLEYLAFTGARFTTIKNP